MRHRLRWFFLLDVSILHGDFYIKANYVFDQKLENEEKKMRSQSQWNNMLNNILIINWTEELKKDVHPY